MKLRVTYDHVKTTPTAYGATLGAEGWCCVSVYLSDE